MTTIYIEEITSSDEEVEQHEEMDDNEEEATGIKNQKANNDSEKKQSYGTKFKFQAETLQACPIAIGGGASFSVIDRKGYVFGGCSRSGNSFSEVHRFDFGTSLNHNHNIKLL